MADKTIGDLTQATNLDDESLLVVEQSGEARKMKGQLFKQFVKDSVSEYVQTAAASAAAAEASASEAKRQADYAAYSEQQAGSYVSQASIAASDAGIHADNAFASSTSAANSAYNASRSEANTKTSEQNSKQSEKTALEAANLAAQKTVEVVGYVADAPPPIVESSGGTVIAASDSAQRPLKGLRLFGKTTQDGTPTPDAPVELVSVGDGGAIETTAAGKNLADLTSCGLQRAAIEINGDSVRIYSATNTGVNHGINFAPVRLAAGIPCTLSLKLDNYVSGEVLFALRRTDTQNVVPGSQVSGLTTAGEYSCTVTPTEDVYVQFVIHITKNEGVFGDATFSNIQMELGDTVTEYEPYRGQTLTVQTPNGLPGIPVTSGGNYTDENGQQWICDEVDFARGKYVQRVNEKVFDGTETILTAGEEANALFIYRFKGVNAAHITGMAGYSLCTHFAVESIYTGASTIGHQIRKVSTSEQTQVVFRPSGVADMTTDTFKEWLSAQYAAGTPVAVIYVLATPIETDLTAEELAAYAALHTNYPNTTVFNDEGAWMEMDYVADTKIYIDNKFAELNAAILSLGGNV